ncbi:sensor histidine kinase [Falsirhodobacter xinxiangensis]|uniref:sensor histidine kinase n=1 Tax=Falsirhodobacter xinxiangensis TaxID=2530049 RepID=UPI0010AB427B|nr:ATP-binding protein [Rhodobacter xinxiangensis]
MERQRLIQWCAIWAAAIVVLMTLGSRVVTRSYLAEGSERTQAALRLTTDGLIGHLRRYEALPRLLAEDEDVRAFIADPSDADAMNDWLKSTNELLESSDIYIIGADGITIAASNFDLPETFIGEDFSYRPYFTEALAGRDSRFYALGTTSGVRGYYYSAPIRAPDGRNAGVMVFKIGLDAIEGSWRGTDIGIFVTDPEGIVFLASDPGLVYATTLPMEPERTERTAASRRYSDAELMPLDHRRGERSGFATFHTGGREYLERSATMPGADWAVHALLDTGPLLAQARLALLAGVLLLAVTGTVGGLILQRRAQLAERLALQAEAQELLEQRVEERTADLARVNSRIKTEVTERRLAEKELRRTQADLVQAGKLAALGRISAALSHEINQPLAAARNYADSAAILIDRQDYPRARENVVQILSLIDRIAAIGHHLRAMARKPNQRLEDLDLAATVREAVAIAGPRLAAARAEVVLDLPDLPTVRGAAVGLQQVLVNLLTNAADAVEGTGDRRIEIDATPGDPVVLRVRDHGPGVPTGIADRIFDPFFSTKQGSGLGLGLSISYNIMKDFGGDLRVTSHPDGGAVFEVVMRSALRMAAE